MHIRRGRYIGVAPLGGGISNVCLVQPWSGGDGPERSRVPATSAIRQRCFAARLPPSRLARALRRARAGAAPVVLGPLAVDVVRDDIEGLLLAGDAAGFIDPMTGDGLRFAVRGGELAAAAALDALEHGWQRRPRAARAAARRREFAAKWRFNRALRALVASPAGVRAAAAGARIAPGVVRRLIVRAGDAEAVA